MTDMELIRTRRSIRTFDGRPVSPEDLSRLRSVMAGAGNPYGVPVEFVLLDAKEHGLSSPVLAGETLYCAGKVKAVPHAEEAYGFSFETLVLEAWALGVGTTWIGGTMKRELFERAAQVGVDERMFCVSPLGYPAKRMSLRELAMRKGVGADARRSAGQLFFDGEFGSPLTGAEGRVADALEMVRLAPSAVNKQPWRVVRRGNDYHFYLKHDKGFGGEWDMQKIDMGIALCHFMRGAGGTLKIEDPRIAAPEGAEYIATVAI